MYSLLLFVVLAQGVTDDSILIGMEGPSQSFSIDEENLGMRLMIAEVNATGGIHGRRLVEVSYSRGTDKPLEQQQINVRRLVEDDGVFLLFNFGGPGSVPTGEYAMANDVPYLFPHTALLTVDGDRHIYTSYPRYDGESRVMLRYLSESRGVRRIAVIHARIFTASTFQIARVNLQKSLAMSSSDMFHVLHVPVSRTTPSMR